MPDFFDVPERRLLLAVLSDAVRHLRDGVAQRAEVVRWIKGKDARIPFQALCDGLHVDADVLARRLIVPRCTLPTFRRIRPRALPLARFARQRRQRPPMPDEAQRAPSGTLEQLSAVTIPQALEAAVLAGFL